MRLKIDIEKSIAQKRLIPTSWYIIFSDYFIYSIFALILIICIIGPVIGKPIIIELKEIIWISLVLIILMCTFFALNKMDRLSEINILKSSFDKNSLILLIKENDWSLIKEADNFLIFNATHWFFHERQVTIIINYNCIFINVMSFGKNDLKSPIYMMKDRSVLNQIIKKIKNNAA